MTVPQMSDPCAELQAALDPALRGAAGVVAAFAPDKVKVYDTPPTMAPEAMPRHYIVLSHFQPLPIDGTDAANTQITLDIWSLTDPRGKLKAQAIGAAAMAAVLAIADLPSHLVKSVQAVSAQYFTDPVDGITAHGIVKAEFVTQPKPVP